MKLNGLKKTGVVLLTFFYSFCAVGLGVNVHYCHGKIAAVSIGFEKDECCCKVVTKRKCCTNKEVVLKIESKQIKTTSSVWTAGEVYYIVRKSSNAVIPYVSFSSIHSVFGKKTSYPPPSPVYLMNKNFRI